MIRLVIETATRLGRRSRAIFGCAMIAFMLPAVTTTALAQSCPPGAHEVGKTVMDTSEGQTIKLKCACDNGFVLKAGQCVARKGSSVTDPGDPSVNLSLVQPGVVLKSWGGRVLRQADACRSSLSNPDCKWVRVTDSSNLRPDDKVRVFPGGFVEITLPNGQIHRHDPANEGVLDIIVDFKFVYSPELFLIVQSQGSPPNNPVRSDGAPGPGVGASLPNLYVDPRSLYGFHPPDNDRPEKMFLAVRMWSNYGPSDPRTGGVCPKCDAR